MEIPLLFSTPMVQAIINKIKNMTRRTRGLDEINKNPDKWIFRMITIDEPKACLMAWFENKETHEYIKVKCPYGVPGCTIWVRETWCKNNMGTGWPYFYKADEENADELKGFWKPSIHMPRSAARLFLTVKSIRVERLQDISEEDAKAEGVIAEIEIRSLEDKSIHEPFGYRLAFTELWDSINSKRGYGWDRNCWVWVVEFERQ